jgi:hypothetical protein
VAARTLRRTVPIDGEILVLSRWADGVVGAVVDRGPGGIALCLVDVETGSVETRPLPGASRGLASIDLMPDGVTLVEQYLPESGPGRRWVLRTLAADPAADSLTPLPEASVALAGGLARLECVPPPPGAMPAYAAVRVVPVYADVVARTVPLTSPSCLDVRVSADNRWLVETTSQSLTADRSVLRLTDLADGAQMQVVLPKVRSAVYQTRQRTTLTRDQRIVVQRDPAGGATVYATISDSLDVRASNATVLRARAVPIPGGSQQHAATNDGRFVVAIEPGQGPTVTDRRSGAVLGTAAMDLRPDNSQIQTDTDMWGPGS